MQTLDYRDASTDAQMHRHEPRTSQRDRPLGCMCESIEWHIKAL